MTQTELSFDPQHHRILAPCYQLEFPADRPFLLFKDYQGHPLMELFYPSAVNSSAGLDDGAALSGWQVRAEGDALVLTNEITTALWTSKRVQVFCFPDRLSYRITVEGEGSLTDVQYFGGYSSAIVRWGSGFFWSGQRFLQAFNPEPNTREQNYHSPDSNLVIDMMGVPLPGRDDWFFTPPPFCYSFEISDGWLGLSIACSPGQNQYSAYRYHGREGAFYLSLSYEGQTQVKGAYRLPEVQINFGPDAYTVLDDHARQLRRMGYAPDVQRVAADWWSLPIYCGWGSQCYLASVDGARAPDYATQVNYEGFLQALDRNNICPGTIVIDDKWQRTYGQNDVDLQKWPDLPGFIREQHFQGRHVLLWLKFWDPEGLTAEACVRNAAGLPVAVDPTNPLYEETLRDSVRNMLSESGYGADGFKIDFSARIPASPGLSRAGSEWGLELMRRYLWIVYDEAKRVKPDALVIAHTPHPYLADVLDMIRLNDINTGRDVIAAMRHRQRVATIACPQALIDTDNWPMTDRATWRAYLEVQPELGVPALYFATHVDNTREPLTEEDILRLIDVWKMYSLTRRQVELTG
jgi:hypothetical protein